MNDVAEGALLAADRLEQVTEIVSAFVSKNSISPTDLPKLIAETHQALRSLSDAEVQPVAEQLKPAVPIRRSITPDFIICLDNGKKFKSLKRHLSVLGMTPDEYRAKWGLPSDYPMVAPNYSAARSSMAKSSGLGRKPVATPVAPTKRTKKPKVDA
ncbi:MucR family transcriptional regulator [Devosia sp.]|uniref:MucR family transcriptional regulator n=1 Tax=Devosia sp. TaxID=1871048 RepID=UPI0027345A70|nr:MucR family transcriptional regulator [Devosia sp.]MDP2779160.1 MucR family transcriptional regulator [Devosia sp.]